MIFCVLILDTSAVTDRHPNFIRSDFGIEKKPQTSKQLPIRTEHLLNFSRIEHRRTKIIHRLAVALCNRSPTEHLHKTRSNQSLEFAKKLEKINPVSFQLAKSACKFAVTSSRPVKN